jgi:2-keto-4-pentenoate hydratase/2-oxohepta-3-ene-1,7-dioic acid hydratase in catechol pathway
MRFASFSINGSDSWGLVRANDIADLGPSGLGLSSDLRTAISSGLLAEAQKRAAQAPQRALGEVTFLPVIPEPRKIICAGINYRTHRDEASRAAVGYPTLFTRFADSQIGHEQPALRFSDHFDYEGELALIIGQDAYRVEEKRAMDVVAGLACYNDFSVRDWQKHSPQWTAGKNFPGTGAFGPWMVTPDEVPDLDNLLLTTRINGQVRQEARLGDMLFPIARLISYITSFTKLAAGDVIITGTPGGVGLFMSPPTFLQEGDVAEVEIQNIGLLRNKVTRPQLGI